MTPTDWPGPVVGVLGGLGPAATAVFMDVLVRATAADRDQDHLDLVVAQHSSIPDRTASILDPAAPDPGPVIARDAVMLERIGAGMLVLPCNTAHHFARQVEDSVSIPLVSIVEQTAQVAVETAAGRPVAVFATEGNIRARVYQDTLERLGAEVAVPDRDLQDALNHLIYEQVKAGRPVDRELFDQCADQAIATGAGTVVLGCTELSVVYDQNEFRGDPRMVDSLTELARATVRAAGKTLSPDFA